MTVIRCVECGTEVTAGCSCGVAYLPASERAARAIARNPGRSDRAIAAEIDTSHTTVRRARQSSTGTHVPVRQGRDGRVRRLPRRPTTQSVDDEAKKLKSVKKHLKAMLAIDEIAVPAEQAAELHALALAVVKRIKQTILPRKVWAELIFDDACDVNNLFEDYLDRLDDDTVTQQAEAGASR